MKRALFTLSLLAAMIGSVSAMPAVPQIVSIHLNKKGILLGPVSDTWLRKAARTLGVEAVIIRREGDLSEISLRFPRQEQVRRIGSSADLSRWFVDRSCLSDWDRFSDCLNAQRSPADEALYRRLDREFVSRVICEEGRKKDCDPDFIPWAFRWRIPAVMELEADIGKPGGFKNVKEAKRSLHRINALLKRVLHGARFPEGFGEGHSEDEVYYEDRISLPPEGVGEKTEELLRMLQKSGFLYGLENDDTEAIRRLAKGGKRIFYLPPGCAETAVLPGCGTGSVGDIQERQECAEKSRPGWHAVPNNIRLRFDAKGCPRLESLR